MMAASFFYLRRRGSQVTTQHEAETSHVLILRLVISPDLSKMQVGLRRLAAACAM